MFERLHEARLAKSSVLVFCICLLVTAYALLADLLYLFKWGGFNFQRILLCGLLVLFLFLHLIHSAVIARPIDHYKSVLWFLPIFIVFIGHYLYFNASAFFPFEGLMFLLFFLVVGLNGIAVSNSVGVVPATVAVCNAVVVICAFYAALTIIHYVVIIHVSLSPRNLIPWGFPNIRFWSHLATWFLPLFPLASMISPLRRYPLWGWVVAFTAATWWWVVIISAAHGTMVALAISIFLVLILFGRSAKEWIRALFEHLIAGILLWLLLSVVVSGLLMGGAEASGSSIDANAQVRFVQWKEAMEMSLVNFPFGMGGQSWLTHEPITPPYIEGAVFPYGHPHNMYMLWVAEYGWVSIIALLVPFVYAIYRLMKHRSSMSGAPLENRAVIISVTCSVVAALMHSGVSSVLLAPASMLAGLLILSVFWGMILPAHKPGPNKISEGGEVSPFAGASQRKVRLLWGLLCWVALWVGIVFWEGVLAYYDAAQADSRCFLGQIELGYMPRFWQHGYFPNPLDYQCD